MENLSFPEAFRALAERAGIELPKFQKPKPQKILFAEHGDQPPSASQVEDSSELSPQDLRSACAWAEDRYHRFFQTLPTSHPARRYAEERGLWGEMSERFHIGFSPSDWNWLEKEARKDGFSIAHLIAAGFLKTSEQGKVFDRFRGRLIFPIHDAQGRSVGVGGRKIPDVECSYDAAKYVNTPETPIFAKHKLLYALDLAKSVVFRKKRVLIMEGYTDVIAAHRHGFQDAVAILGTALGIDHIKTLRRMAETIYLVLDGDAAGQRRTAEVLELFVAEKVDVRVLTLPEAQDPAEFLATHDSQDFETLLEKQAVDAYTHALNTYTEGLDISNIHQAEMVSEKILQLVASADRFNNLNFAQVSFREERLLQKLASTLTISEEFLRKRLREIREKARRDGFLRTRRQQEYLGSVGDEGNDENTLSPLLEGEAELDASAKFSSEDGFLGDAADISTLTGLDFEKAADLIDWKVFGTMDAWERELMHLLLSYPALLGHARQHILPEQLKYQPARELLIRMSELQDDGRIPTLQCVLTSFESEKMKNWTLEEEARSMWRHESKSQDDVSRLLDELIANFELHHYEGAKLRLKEAFQNPKVEDSQKAGMLENLILQKKRVTGLL